LRWRWPWANARFEDRSITVAASMRRPVCVKSYESSANVFFSFISF
jgi:hypothetical protein